MPRCALVVRGVVIDDRLYRLKDIQTQLIAAANDNDRSEAEFGRPDDVYMKVTRHRGEDGLIAYDVTLNNRYSRAVSSGRTIVSAFRQAATACRESQHQNTIYALTLATDKRGVLVDGELLTLRRISQKLIASQDGSGWSRLSIRCPAACERSVITFIRFRHQATDRIAYQVSTSRNPGVLQMLRGDAIRCGSRLIGAYRQAIGM